MAYPRIDVEDAVKFGALFASITEQDRSLVIGYLSALNDKAIADKNREQQDKPLAVSV